MAPLKDNSKLCECGCGELAPIATRDRKERGQKKGQPLRFLPFHHQRTETFRNRQSQLRRGVPISEAHKQKIKESRLSGDKVHNWKGEDASYWAIHDWVARWKNKSGICVCCGKNTGTDKRFGTEWANISGEYKRDLNDYIELCKKCHKEFDRQKGGKNVKTQ